MTLDGALEKLRAVGLAVQKYPNLTDLCVGAKTPTGFYLHGGIGHSAPDGILEWTDPSFMIEPEGERFRAATTLMALRMAHALDEERGDLPASSRSPKRSGAFERYRWPTSVVRVRCSTPPTTSSAANASRAPSQ
jgi:hypothetical protein